MGPKEVIVEISNRLNLQRRSDRFQLCFHLINLARVIKTVVDRFPTQTMKLYHAYDRMNGCTIEIRDDSVAKRICVAGSEYEERFALLRDLYTSLSIHRLPCVPECRSIRKCSTESDIGGFIELIILPLGCRIIPTSLQQLLIALTCVLRALVSLHRLRYAHQDIRWPNILYVSDDYWMLIDFENAVLDQGLPLQNDIRMVGEWISEWISRHLTQTP